MSKKDFLTDFLAGIDEVPCACGESFSYSPISNIQNCPCCNAEISIPWDWPTMNKEDKLRYLDGLDNGH